MTSSFTSSFTFSKREFLHYKLDEIIKMWQRGLGQGSFAFNVDDGTPDFQCGIHLDFDDSSGMAPNHPSFTPPPPFQPHHRRGHDGVRRHGPARRARDRDRAARYQAAQAVAAASVAKSFPGTGNVVGTAPKPVLPIPLRKGYFFPPSSAVCSTLPSTTISTSTR